MTESSNALATAAVRRPRLRRPPPPVRRPLWWYALGLCGLVFALRWGHASWTAGRAELQFVGAPGADSVPELELTFFPAQLAFAAPSPPPPLGSLQVAPGVAAAAVGADLVPDEAVVRYRGAGLGTGFAFVRRGVPNAPIRLQQPGSLRGRVFVRRAVSAFGSSHEFTLPVAGAEILAMGGGEHGVPLASAASDALGRFELQGFDSSLRSLSLRVRAPSHVLLHHDLQRTAEAWPAAELELEATTPRPGQLLTPPEILPRSLRILARGLPGVEALPDTRGQFVLDHVEATGTPRLLVHGLPPGFAQLPVQSLPGKPLVVEVIAAAVVRGQVRDRVTGAPMAGVLVWSGDGDAVRADDDGRFVLDRLLPGPNELTAQWRKTLRRKANDLVRVGTAAFELRAGEVRTDCVIHID